MNYIIVRIVVIIVAIFSSFVVYYYIFRPAVLQPLCLVNTNGCVRIAYYSYNNSALVHLENSGIWLWYNGFKAFVYGQNVGQVCQDPTKYEAAYAINTLTGEKEGYDCVTPLATLLKFYQSKGGMEYLYKRINANTFDVYAALNLLQNERIIDLGR
jgi:hypothetical protein